MVEPSLPQQPASPLPRQARGPRAIPPTAATRPPTCPAWCRVLHGEQLGEEDNLHLSEPVLVAGTTIRLCATIDPVTGEHDGPYVLVGEDEYSLVEAEALLAVLRTQLDVARESFTRPEAP